MAARHCQWHLCIKQYKRVTASGAFALAHPDYDPLPLDQHYYCRSTTKDVTVSGAFALHHYQWRAVIRRFQILFLSLLLLII
jgi:hypothetical protein